MRNHEILKQLVGFAACVRAFGKTPRGAGFVVVTISERHSDICLVRGGVELTRESIAVGAVDFADDVECAGFIRDTLKRAGAGETPVLLGREMQGFYEVV